jgi:hypothetical protein
MTCPQCGNDHVARRATTDRAMSPVVRRAQGGCLPPSAWGAVAFVTTRHERRSALRAATLDSHETVKTEARGSGQDREV